MPITIGSNIASLGAQRQLGNAGQKLATVFESLSSGQRINRASDDAAGLAISMGLDTNSRVFTQSIRNVNDAISANSIAQGAISSMSDVITRLSELAEGAANGTYSTQQREAMNTEAQALKEEYNRVVETAKFNGVALLDDDTGTIRIQAGHTADTAALFLSTGSTNAGFKGTGEIDSISSSAIGAPVYGSNGGDFDNNGRMDLISASSNGVFITKQNGDGSFSASISLGTVAVSDVQIADLNGDGNIDIVGSVTGGAVAGLTATVLYGNGDGTFKSEQRLTGATGADQVEVGDMNGDGILDVVTSTSASSQISVYINSGSGAFSSAQTITANNAQGFELSDINNDGRLDAVSSDLGSGQININYGTGNGGLQAASTVAGLADNRDLTVADFNQDGLEDIIVTSTSTNRIGVVLATGAGTFATAVSYTIPALGTRGITTGDFNGDQIADVAVSTASSIGFLIGNGDGTFKAYTSTSSLVGSGIQLNTADMNNDGVQDLLSTSVNAGIVGFTKTTGTSRLGLFDLRTRGGALGGLDYFKGVQDRLSLAMGKLGSDESRFSVALNTLSISRENYLAANSRILDVDVAEAAAQLTSTSIQQQAAAAVLTQANQQPSLALRLLGSS